MRKSYIGWWVASAWFFFASCKAACDYVFFPQAGDGAGYPVLFMFFVLAGLFFFLGYRRWKEYQEYQEDRKIRNEYYKSNTKPDEEERGK